MLAMLSFAFTILFYVAAKRLYRRFPRQLLTPLLVAPVAVIALLLLCRIPWAAYEAGTRGIAGMIGPATIAMAVPLYKHFGVLRKHAAAVLVSVLLSAVFGIVASAGMAQLLHLNPALIESLAPRSATTPIAMAASSMVGGVPTITAALVMATGLLGMLLGPLVIRVGRIHHDVARGVLFGASSHTAGTAKAFEFGQVPGAVSSIAMVLTAFLVLCLTPLLLRAFA